MIKKTPILGETYFSELTIGDLDKKEISVIDNEQFCSSVNFSDNQVQFQRFTAEQCWLVRNEIYARHGRRFDDEYLRDYFNSKEWYTPTIDPDEFEESLLNSYEIANRDLIVEYERERGYR